MCVRRGGSEEFSKILLWIIPETPVPLAVT